MDPTATQYLIGAATILCGIYLGKIIHSALRGRSILEGIRLIISKASEYTQLFEIFEFILSPSDCLDLAIEKCKKRPIYHVSHRIIKLMLLSDVKDIEIVMKSPAATQKSFVHGYIDYIVPNSLFSGHGPKMRANRKILVPYINGEYLVDYVETFNVLVCRFLDKLITRVQDGEFDVYHESEYCVANITYETIFGIPGVSESPADPNVCHLADKFLMIAFQRALSPWLYSDFMFNRSKLGKQFRKCKDDIQNFTYNIIADKKKLYLLLSQDEKGLEKPKPSIMDQLIENNMHTNAMSDEEIYSNITALFAGFADTVLGIYSFAILMLAMHTEIQKRAREEIVSVIGDKKHIHFDDISKLKYIDMVIKETIRLFPAGPLIPRTVTEDITLENGILPKGYTIGMMMYVVHKSEEHWKDPEKFWPERFLLENSKGRHSYAYLPFSSGARMCPGMKYGMSSLKVMVSQFVRKYQLSTKMSMDTLKLTTHISVRSQNGYKISIREVN